MDEVLSGKHGAARDIVLLNAAATLYAGNVVPSLADGVQAAEEAIDSGKAKAKKEEFIRFTQQFAINCVSTQALAKTIPNGHSFPYRRNKLPHADASHILASKYSVTLAYTYHQVEPLALCQELQIL